MSLVAAAFVIEDSVQDWLLYLMLLSLYLSFIYIYIYIDHIYIDISALSFMIY